MAKRMQFHRVGLLVLCFGMKTVTYAQNTSRATPEERARKQTTTMREVLVLTDEQEQKVAEINLRYARKNEGVANNGGGRMAKMNAVKANRNRKNGEMKEVLTPDQYEKYLELQEQNAARMRQQRMQ
ncbi:MAG: hypothetical protein KF744_08560 [Taibaiella sp.]|nr:hypothetical protein [Taibaiella sp.]